MPRATVSDDPMLGVGYIERELDRDGVVADVTTADGIARPQPTPRPSMSTATRR